jgi:iron-sulfur cluster assembly accessory protein
MMINVTESAKDYLLGVLAKNSKQFILMAINGKGCNGYSYEYGFVTKVEFGDLHIPLDADHALIVDSISLPYIEGSTLDYVSNINGSALVVNNPLATSQCGCGTSFSV